MAPSFEFIDRVFLPYARRLGWDVDVSLRRAGFYPKGGGVLTASIRPGTKGEPLVLEQRGAIEVTEVHAMVAGLSRSIAEREVEVLRGRMGAAITPHVTTTVEELKGALGPGNAAYVLFRWDGGTELFGAPGVRGVSAEAVAHAIADEAVAWRDADVPVGPHLADQLLLPMALGPGGRFRTTALSDHTKTQIESIRRFVPANVVVRSLDGSVEVSVAV